MNGPTAECLSHGKIPISVPITSQSLGNGSGTLVKLLATHLTHHWLSQMKSRDIIGENVPKSDTKAWESANDCDQTAKVSEQERETLGM